MSDELLPLARKRAETDALVRDLLAEVERLTEVLKVQLRANVAVSDHAVAETRRAIRAEARLRELASAEAVAFGHSFTEGAIPLIRRPSMEKNL